MNGPYAYAATDYWSAGWRGLLPLPPRKKTWPPTGYTGWDGAYPSYADVMGWVEDHADGNIALRLPLGVLGVDVDDYGNKVGGESLKLREAAWGELPPTWRTTSRDDGVSGIRLYRVPVSAEGRSLHWPGKVGPAIETVHFGHRYAVVPPSIHPDTGSAYRWVAPDGSVTSDAPRVSELPELPWGWIEGLTQGREADAATGLGMGDDEIEAWLRSHYLGDEACGPMIDAKLRMLEAMPDGAHESLSYLMTIVNLAGIGHHGLRGLLVELRSAFLAEVRGRRQDEDQAAKEWRRSLFGAVDKTAARFDEANADFDPCEVLVSPAATPEPAIESWEPLPGGADEVSEAPAGEDSLDIETPAEDAPRVLTPEERREMAIVKAEYDLEIRNEAKQRQAAKHAPPLEWLDSDAFLDGPEPEPLVPRLLYKDSLARVYGKAGCGKSFLSIDLAYSLATGRPWAGMDVERTKVAYVMAEGRRVNTRRGKAWLDRHGIERGELRGWFHAVPHKVLLTEEGVRELVGQVTQHEIGLVILDTKNAMMVGDENSAEDFALLRRALDRLREATEACVVLIDHTGYGETARARGSSAGEAGMDTEVHVLNDGQSPPQITVTVTRDKADEAGAAWEFMLRTHPIDDDRPPAVLLPMGEVDLPTRRPMPEEVEVAWRESEAMIPLEVAHYTGDGAAAVPDLARFMAHDAGSADRNHIGVTRAEATTALSEKTMGKGHGYSRSSVRRAWSALRDLGYISPADGKDGSDGKAENTIGKHVWSPT